MRFPGLLVGAFVCGILSWWIAPDRISAIGVMDQALSSSNPLVRETAILEVRAGKVAFGAMAMLLLVLWLSMPRMAASNWYTAILHENRRFPEAYEAHQGRFGTTSALISAVGLITAAFYLVYGAAFLSEDVLGAVNNEDGVLETMSVVFLFVASLLAFRIGLQAKRSNYRIMHFFLSFLFIVMCGEEISWGQRLLEFDTPETLQKFNVQNEFNFHNMFGYVIDHLFILCFFLWGCVVPYLYWNSAFWRWFQSSIGLPMPSMGLAVAMGLVTLTQAQITDVFLGTVPALRVPELRELLSTMCFVLMMTESRYLAPRLDTAVRLPS